MVAFGKFFAVNLVAFCILLWITDIHFDPDQEWLNFGPGLYLNCLSLLQLISNLSVGQPLNMKSFRTGVIIIMVLIIVTTLGLYANVLVLQISSQ